MVKREGLVRVKNADNITVVYSRQQKLPELALSSPAFSFVTCFKIFRLLYQTHHVMGATAQMGSF